MAACSRCGARLPDLGARCRRCGAPPPPKPGETLPFGSPGDEPEPGSTLLLGSGVPLDDPPPRHEGAPEAPQQSPAKPLTLPLPKPAKARARRIRRPAGPPPQKPTPKLGEPTPAEAPPSRPAWVLRARRWRSVGVVALLVGGAGSWLLAARGGQALPLAGSVRFDSAGRPVAELACEDCPDGTELRRGDVASAFQQGRASIELAPPLALGRTTVTLGLRRPGAARFESHDVPLSVDFIPSADLHALSQPNPRISLLFEAMPGVAVVVDGRALSRAPTGSLRYELDITADLTGNAAKAERFSRSVPYAVRLPGGESLRGSFELASEVTPLWVEAPGESIVIEASSFMLAGSTQAEGSVSVEGRPITVDPAGRFAQLMSVSSVGDTTITVRAAAPGRAPRLVKLRIRRVASLAEEAARFRQNASERYDAIAEGVEQKLGWAVALSGQLTEVVPRGHTSSLTLAVEAGCPEKPCLARLELASRSTFAAGERITAYGYLSGKASDRASGRAIPQVRVEFLRGGP